MNLSELKRLEEIGDDAFYCKGCSKLHTRCACGEIALRALPALIRVAEAAEAVMRESAHSGFYSGSSASARLDLEIALRALEEQ